MIMIDAAAANKLRLDALKAVSNRATCLKRLFDTRMDSKVEFSEALQAYDAAVEVETRLSDAVAAMEKLWKSESGSSHVGWSKTDSSEFRSKSGLQYPGQQE